MKRLLSPRFLAIVTVTALATGLLYVSADTSSHTVTAQFTSAAPLVEGNQVKLDGVVVGKVTKLQVRNKLAEVTMDLDEAVLPVYQDATFTIRPVSLLGERYIDLERGNPKSKPLPPGSTVDVKQTATNVGMDEVLNTFDDPTGQGLAMLLTTLGEGVRGNGKNADAAIE